MQGKLFALNRGFQAGLVLAMAIVACIAANALAADDQQSFGERQLSQVLEDRPNMKEIVDADNFIHEWVIRQFEGDSQAAECIGTTKSQNLDGHRSANRLSDLSQGPFA
jgi:hypothetical protein